MIYVPIPVRLQLAQVLPERSYRMCIMEDRRMFNEPIETMERETLDDLIDERVRYTIRYARDHSLFYSRWFKKHGIDPRTIETHEDLSQLPVITGTDIRSHQPPNSTEFEFKSASWEDIFTIHETSGTSGIPKSFFLTWQEWERLAEKYARIFVSQGFGKSDRMVICASYGMNVGANTMTLAGRNLGITIIPTGKCSFPVRTITNYRPTGIVGSVFKLIHLARRMKAEGIEPQEAGVRTLVIGGEAFADESRAYLADLWGCEVYNTYGSTEGTMCGECSAMQGLHVPEDLVHMDLYDIRMKEFVREGECGRIVLTTLLPVGAKCGSLLINYDTEDTTVVVGREPCRCGRTHMRIYNPQREAETSWINGVPVNRVDVERSVFQRENMEYLTGEYEAFLYSGDERDTTQMRVGMECISPEAGIQDLIAENFQKAFFRSKPPLKRQHEEGLFSIRYHFPSPGGLELASLPGRPKRFVDRR